MKLSLISAAPALLLASSAAFAQQAPAPVAPAPAPAAAVAAEPAAPVAAPTAVDFNAVPPAPAPLAAAPAEVLPAPVPEVPLATKLGVSKEGFFQPGATLQFWAIGTNEGGDTLTAMRVRRAELKMKGDIIPKLFSYNVMIDPARVLDNSTANVRLPSGETVPVANQGNVGILGDLVLTFMSDYADVSVGQFKTPLSYEGYNSASKLLFPERALVSRRYGDVRDIGIKVEKKLGKFYYQAAVFNGEGQNRPDPNSQKDGALRFELYPVDGVTIGLVGYAGLNNRDINVTKDRLEADVRVDINHFLLQAEYIHGWDGPTAVARNEGAGFYAALGYTFFDRLQPIVRIGTYDPNVRTNLKPAAPQRFAGNNAIPTSLQDEVVSYELGLNYYLRGQDAKVQLAWSKFVFADQLNRGEAILAVQAGF